MTSECNAYRITIDTNVTSYTRIYRSAITDPNSNNSTLQQCKTVKSDKNCDYSDLNCIFNLEVSRGPRS